MLILKRMATYKNGSIYINRLKLIRNYHMITQIKKVVEINFQIYNCSHISAKSTSTGCLLALKIQQMKRNSENESLHRALFEVSNEANIYQGKMLKKAKNMPRENPHLRRKRSKSMDATAYLKNMQDWICIFVLLNIRHQKQQILFLFDIPMGNRGIQKLPKSFLFFDCEYLCSRYLNQVCCSCSCSCSWG